MVAFDPSLALRGGRAAVATRSTWRLHRARPCELLLAQPRLNGHGFSAPTDCSHVDVPHRRCISARARSFVARGATASQDHRPRDRLVERAPAARLGGAEEVLRVRHTRRRSPRRSHDRAARRADEKRTEISSDVRLFGPTSPARRRRGAVQCVSASYDRARLLSRRASSSTTTAACALKGTRCNPSSAAADPDGAPPRRLQRQALGRRAPAGAAAAGKNGGGAPARGPSTTSIGTRGARGRRQCRGRRCRRTAAASVAARRARAAAARRAECTFAPRVHARPPRRASPRRPAVPPEVAALRAQRRAARFATRPTPVEQLGPAFNTSGRNWAPHAPRSRPHPRRAQHGAASGESLGARGHLN